MKKAKPFLMFFGILLIDLVLLTTRPELGTKVLSNTFKNIKEMLGVIPPIFLLLGLMDVWVPRQTIIKFLGEKSGVLGITLSVVMGAAAAGPLYGAFPVAGMMMNKGAKFTNILIFLGAWSTMKIPMFLYEISALGLKFALTRWIVDMVGIIIIALLIDKMVPREEQNEIYRKHSSESMESRGR